MDGNEVIVNAKGQKINGLKTTRSTKFRQGLNFNEMTITAGNQSVSRHLDLSKVL